jgi:cyanophycin synthetase
MTQLYREGARLVGVWNVPDFDTELEALQALLAQSRPGDVVAVMCHQDRPSVEEWLASQGGTPDDAGTVRRKVMAAAVR